VKFEVLKYSAYDTVTGRILLTYLRDIILPSNQVIVKVVSFSTLVTPHSFRSPKTRNLTVTELITLKSVASASTVLPGFRKYL
jgi:hypothetical protein